ncbi:MAG: GAF domain-containing protein [bacterium]
MPPLSAAFSEGTAVKDYALTLARAAALLEDEEDSIAAMANLSALLWEEVEGLNWVGFYRAKGENLVLGPFQGKVACARIGFGKGVCGTAWAEGRTQLVPDVHAFPGHIACDSASRSELVVPVREAAGEIFAVLDADSPLPARFTGEEAALFEAVAALLGKVG